MLPQLLSKSPTGQSCQGLQISSGARLQGHISTGCRRWLLSYPLVRATQVMSQHGPFRMAHWSSAQLGGCWQIMRQSCRGESGQKPLLPAGADDGPPVFPVEVGWSSWTSLNSSWTAGPIILVDITSLTCSPKKGARVLLNVETASKRMTFTTFRLNEKEPRPIFRTLSSTSLPPMSRGNGLRASSGPTASSS